jgi:hypothetical protein
MEDLVRSVGSVLLQASLIAGLIASAITGIAVLLGKRYLERKLESERALYAERIDRLKAGYDRDLEGHRARVRFTEVYFQRQLEACDDLFALFESMLPAYRFPDMDWGDALEDMARDMERVEGEVKQLRTKYFSVLPDDVVQKLSSAVAYAGSAKFEIENGELSVNGRTLVENVYNTLNEATSSLKGFLDGHRHSLVEPVLGQQATSSSPSRTSNTPSI